ncbi:Tubulin tyrosine ligase [Spironucleus salmonicida]|uniref:Tubulin--tyrosine ligase-like protein 9 n=1 Tax=Spironucleus salmonicida TaxID=348837 RepID=V6LW75_9EUKA|nr:Tubulin tyrosine ligase [Spironucleus salmonicida]|eukprot:EST45064.1 Tubulin tyrosine ligase [Spironucleus salmonicida]
MHFRNTIYRVALERNWVETQDDQYNFAWLEKYELAEAYKKNAALINSKNFYINHFQNHQVITRKDLLAMNINKTLRFLHKFSPKLLNAFAIMPETFILPQNWSQFQQKKDNQTTYIVKPANRAQGKGIFMAKYFEIQDWYKQDYPEICKQAEALDFKLDFKLEESNIKSGLQLYLVQKYIHNPLLINQHKFDLRLYVLVRSFQPLDIWICRQGFARFALTKYEKSADPSAHLTNIAIQKHTNAYNKNLDGAKWTVQDLFEYMCNLTGEQNTRSAFRETEKLIVRILQIVAGQMNQNKCSFEVYGFDVMFDDELRVSLLEVNACPSLSADTAEDEILKKEMLHDAISIVVDGMGAEKQEFGCWHRIHQGVSVVINSELFRDGEDVALEKLDRGLCTGAVQLGDQVSRAKFLVQ